MIAPVGVPEFLWDELIEVNLASMKCSLKDLDATNTFV